MAGVGGIAGRLYRGDVSVNFVGRQRTWYTISGLIVLVSAIALIVRKLNFSVEFKGGTVFTFPATTGGSSQVQGQINRLVSTQGGGDSTVQLVVSHLIRQPTQWTVTTKALSDNLRQSIGVALEHAFHVTASQMQITFVGASWGSQITSKAIEALIVFLVVIVIYLSIALDRKSVV